MKFYPKSYLKNVLEVDESFLKENNIKAILLDIDNTILNTDNIMIEGLEDWINKLKKIGIKFCILSNTNRKKKAEKISKILDIPYIFFAMKPFKRGFNKAKKIVGEENENIAVIGDQILTDVLGANRSKMYSILVEPLQKKDILITRINRLIERKILKKYLEKNNKEKNETN